MQRYLAITVVVALAMSLTGSAQSSGVAPGRAAVQKTRIGVFDSRMVALAYYNSPEHRRFMQQFMSDLKQAKAENNQTRVKELEFQGPALQNLQHYQVFSSASIPNITEKLAAALPNVAQQAGVSLIVSKWDVAFRGPDVEYVDVTDALVQQFHPDERVQKWIAEGRTKDPLPLLQTVMTLRPER